MRAIILVLGWVAVCMPISGQVAFSKLFSNYPLNSESAWTIAEIDDGFIVVNAHDCAGQDVIVCGTVSRIDKNGDILWFKQYDYYPHSSNSLLIHNDKIYLSGTTNQGEQQYFVYCLNMDGHILWEREYGSPTKGELGSLLFYTSNGEIMLTGIRKPTNSLQKQEAYLMTLDLDWNVIDEHAYDLQNAQTLVWSSIETTNGQRLFSYKSCPWACVLDRNGGVASVDTAGNLLWNNAFPIVFEPDRPKVIQTDSSTLAVNFTKDTVSMNTVLTPPVLMYMDLSGNITSKYSFYNNIDKKVADISPVWEKGLVGAGRADLGYTGSSTMSVGWAFRFDENRELIWQRYFADTTQKGKDFSLDNIIPTKDGGFIAVGNGVNNMTGVTERHNWILKLDAMGCVEPGCGDTSFVTTASSEPVFLKGKDIKIYPNPADTYVNLEFPDEFDLKGLTVSLVSNTGRTVKTVDVAGREMRLDLPDLPSGVYFLMIRKRNEVITSNRIILNH